MSRVAVVTGASSGIGAEIARLLSARGDLCILLARRADRLQALAEELGGEAEICDVSDRAAVESVGARILERHPKIDVLVNNAGIPGRTSFLAADPEVIERLIRINYLGGIWCLRAFLPGLRAAAPSDVVNIVSVSGVVAEPRSGPYAASKHAQLAFSRASAADLRREGIRVHTVKPGFVETEGFPQSWLPLTRAAGGDSARGRRCSRAALARRGPRRDDGPVVLRADRPAPGCDAESLHACPWSYAQSSLDWTHGRARATADDR